MTYTPQANGTVERVNRDMLQLMRAIALEKELAFVDNWPFLLPIIMSNINSRPSKRLADYCPRTVFTNLPADKPLDVYYNPHDRHLSAVSIDFDMSASLSKHLETVQSGLDSMHAKVVLSKAKIRARNTTSGLSKIIVNFVVGDFVLVAKPQPTVSKLEAVWRGPYTVVEAISEHLYRVKSLDGLQTFVSHTSRVKYFADSDMDVTAKLIDTVNSQDKWISTYVPAEVLDSQLDVHGDMYVLVRWEGFTTVEATWEPLEQFWEDAPNLLDEFLSKYPRSFAQARSAIESWNLQKSRDAASKADSSKKIRLK
jgi:hypothetical protein